MGFDLTTFLFELVNFGLLLWILQRVLYRPLREGIERRRAAIAAEHERSVAEQDSARALRHEAEARLGEIEKLRETIVADAREQAAKEEARILEQAREDARAERERVERTLERERAEARAWMRETTIDNAVDIAGHLLNDLLPEVANAILLDALVESLDDSFAEQGEASAREGMVAAIPNRPLEVDLTMPVPPPEAGLAALRSALARVLEEPFRLVLHEDPSLVAGAVLRLGDRVLDASISGHLTAVRDRAHTYAHEAHEVDQDG